jgi:hypothetical protein
MKENAYLLNCRNQIVDAINDIPYVNAEYANQIQRVRARIMQALSELDAFRHGQLQHCPCCPDMGEDPPDNSKPHEFAVERWIREVTDVLVYQPEIPLDHKKALVEAFAAYRKSIGRPLRD